MNEWMLVYECRSICVPQENNKTKKMFSFHLGVSVCVIFSCERERLCFFLRHAFFP